MHLWFSQSRKVVALICGMVFLATMSGYVWQLHATPHTAYKTAAEADPYVRFDMEAYDIVQTNYWQQVRDPDLSRWFLVSVQSVTSSSTLTLASSTRAGTAELLSSVLQGKSDDEKRRIALDTVRFLVQHMQPTGRGELLSSVAKTDFVNNVDNVHPTSNLYQSLGLSPGASVASVDQAFAQKKKELQATTSPLRKEQLAEVVHAHDVLADSTHKAIYDQSGAEPTIFVHRFGDTLYIDVKQIASTTLEEFTAALDAASTTPYNSMILDLRGNIGGDLTFAQPFLSLFLGPGQYAFDFYRNGVLEPQRTLGASSSPSLERMREVAVLTDDMTQSTSEVLAASLKRSRLAKIVGTKTRGWGSIEELFPMQTSVDASSTYSLLLVVGLTVRDDQNPIEGNGVLPNVDTTNPHWQAELSQQFFSPDLIAALKRVATNPPLQ